MSANRVPTADASARSLKVLVAVSSFLYVKFYDSVFRRLAEQGHRVHVVADRGDRDQRSEWMLAMKRLAADHPAITFAFAPARRDHWWVDLGYWINRGLDHVRFFAAQFDRAPVLRRRAEGRGWGIFKHLTARRWLARPWVGRLIEHALVAVEKATTRVDHLEDMLDAAAPDLVIVTPLVTLGAAQGDVVTASLGRGIPTVVAVGSWDHLSSKVRIRVRPDRLLVWNETQRREAFEYHGFPPERVLVTGAQCFDHWFGRSPSRSRAEFCQQLGLPEDRPILLYVGSALFWGSPSEGEFTARWVRALRASPHESLRTASVLVRPHPKRGYEWDGIDLSDLEHVVVWPPRGQAPLDAESKATYFDSLYHSAAVMGINTSAQIEAGLIGRPVYTVLLPEFWDNQEGTLHFQYLLGNGGLLNAARTLDEHADQLAAGLAAPAAAAAKNRAFVSAFVRPHGLDTPATDVLVSAICELAMAGQSIGYRPPWWGPALRWLLFPVAFLTRGTAPRRWVPRPPWPIPGWAWRLRRITRPLAPYLSHVFGSERPWREAYYRLKDERRQQTAAIERGRLEQRTAARRQRYEARRLKLQARAQAERVRVEAERARTRQQALAARERAVVTAARRQQLARRRKAATRRSKELRKTMRLTWKRGTAAVRGRAALVYRRVVGRRPPAVPPPPDTAC